ncbi:MAG: hypothetical protein QOJ29_2689 [Thermoleophilaceae bacterium]|jgi:hypothetical protein|nr:hypothetical protein [Thermoleophilaceae bacterium]
MRDRRGAIGRATELAESVVAGVKRRQAARAPKVLLYDDDGRPRTLDATADAAAPLVETARAMVDLVAPDDTLDSPEEE